MVGGAQRQSPVLLVRFNDPAGQCGQAIQKADIMVFQTMLGREPAVKAVNLGIGQNAQVFIFAIFVA
ncbi:hypothetical protein D3C75_893660 [compost metagenome]